MSLSATALASAFAQNTSEVWLMLLTIDHASLSQPIRVALNNENVTSGGNVYVKYDFEIMIPDDIEDSPRVQLNIDNVDNQIVTALRSIQSPPTAELKVVLASSPNTIEAGPYDLTFFEVEYDAARISAALIFDDILNEPFPFDSFGANSHPGLF